MKEAVSIPSVQGPGNICIVRFQNYYLSVIIMCHIVSSFLFVFNKIIYCHYSVPILPVCSV